MRNLQRAIDQLWLPNLLTELFGGGKVAMVFALLISYAIGITGYIAFTLAVIWFCAQIGL